MIEDKILLLKLKSNSPDALRTIYLKYKDYLLRIATSLLKDTVKAEDIVHDVFLRLAQSGGRIKLFGSLRSYLSTCVINDVRTLFRREKVRAHAEIDVGCLRIAEREPLNWIIEQEDQRDLLNALSELEYELREVIVLHLIGEMKFREIADLQEVSINTVQSRYRNALSKMRSLLKDTRHKNGT